MDQLINTSNKFVCNKNLNAKLTIINSFGMIKSMIKMSKLKIQIKY